MRDWNKIKLSLGAVKNNFLGWRTNRKLVVFESDDWGSIRMPSKEIFTFLHRQGYPVKINPFERFDALECDDDLFALYDTLRKYRDKHGNHPILTANTIMTNPEFGKIKKSQFSVYHSENFLETYKRYPGRDNTFKLIKEGIDEALFHPQYHGREHINIHRWMRELKNPKSDSRTVFELKMVGISSKENPKIGNQLMIAYDFDQKIELMDQIDNLVDGANMFHSIFGYNSNSFIAPVYTWHHLIENPLKKTGIKFIQGGMVQLQPIGNGSSKKIKNYLGKQNEYGQIYLTRNVYFEPVLKSTSIVNQTLHSIKMAFTMKKPAIISIHRINFIGSICEDNRKKNLNQFEQLLREIIKTWPEVEFLTSDQLGHLIQCELKE